MRLIYSLLLYLVWPFIPLYLLKRAKKNPDYKLFWQERFAINLRNECGDKVIWIHAVSVGEVKGLVKIVALIEEQYPDFTILLTQFTPTGRAIAKQLLPNVVVHYLPYDVLHAVHKFYQTFKPAIGLIMETEIWPNLLFYANKFNVPLLLINARLSDKSYRGYQKFKPFIQPVINNLDFILCQDQITYTNFKNLGYQKEISVIGSTKFDVELSLNPDFNLIDKLTMFIKNKAAIVFFSTRETEEQLILDHLSELANYLIIIVPRHPERFGVVEELLIANGIKYQKRTSYQSILAGTQVLLGDSIGEMPSYIAMADIAIMGGSFNGGGGQNLLEPLALDKPVIFGGSIYNFTAICLNALDNGCAIQVADMQQCTNVIKDLLSQPDKYQAMQLKCKGFITQYKGASDRAFKYIQAILNR